MERVGVETDDLARLRKGAEQGRGNVNAIADDRRGREIRFRTKAEGFDRLRLQGAGTAGNSTESAQVEASGGPVLAGGFGLDGAGLLLAGEHRAIAVDAAEDKSAQEQHG